MLITAKFDGLNGSLGFNKGRNYLLTLTVDKKGYVKAVHDKSRICVYESFNSFLKNWKNIKGYN